MDKGWPAALSKILTPPSVFSKGSPGSLPVSPSCNYPLVLRGHIFHLLTGISSVLISSGENPTLVGCEQVIFSVHLFSPNICRLAHLQDLQFSVNGP